MFAVVGATGYTGRLIVGELVRRGLPFVAVGRSAHKLEALEGDFERRVADATDDSAVAAAIRGCKAICSCVGPFVDYGEPALRAAVAAGAHYIDTTGEQAFMRMVFERYSDAPVAVVPAVGFDYVPGDAAAAIAAKALGSPPHSIDVFYSVTKAKSSEGTKRTGLRIASMPCLVLEDGKLAGRTIGSAERRFAFPDGEANVALWPGGEPITVPRHTGARNVAVYMRMPRVAAAAARTAGLAAPALRLGRKALTGTSGPSDEDRARARFAVVAEARREGRIARCVVEGRDMYGMTAAACAEALVRMTQPGFAGRGALSPVEALGAEEFLGVLAPYLSWRAG